MGLLLMKFSTNSLYLTNTAKSASTFLTVYRVTSVWKEVGSVKVQNRPLGLAQAYNSMNEAWA